MAKTDAGRRILLAVIDGIDSTLDNELVWKTTDGIQRILETTRAAAIAATNIGKIAEQARFLQAHVNIRLVDNTAAATEMHNILKDVIGEIEMLSLDESLPTPPSTMVFPNVPTHTPVQTRKAAVSIPTKDEEWRRFLEIRRAVGAASFNPKYIDNPADKVALGAWLPYFPSRVAATKNPYQLAIS